MPVASGDEVLRSAQDDIMYCRDMDSTSPVVVVRDWRQTEAALQAARAGASSPVLITPENAAATYGAGYLAALQERARREFPDVAFTLIVDCGDAPGYALACLRAGVRMISMAEPNEKIADIARQMGAELVRRPT
jgi:fructose/tagatose bisphosphate aldolase